MLYFKGDYQKALQLLATAKQILKDKYFSKAKEADFNLLFGMILNVIRRDHIAFARGEIGVLLSQAEMNLKKGEKEKAIKILSECLKLCTKTKPASKEKDYTTP